jgi:hypothetical protein
MDKAADDPPGPDVPKAKIWGDRNTCTRLVRRVLERDGLVELLPDGSYMTRSNDLIAPFVETLGDATPDEVNRIHQTASDLFDRRAGPLAKWKHREIAYLPAYKRRGVVPILCVKHPLAWIASLHRKPYDSLNPRPETAGFSDFVRAPWLSVRRENGPPVYRNPVEIWNRKARAYLRFLEAARADGVPVVLLQAEGIVSDMDAALRRLEGALGLEPFALTAEEQSTKDASRSRADYARYYATEQWRSAYSSSDLHFVTAEVDWEAARALGYEPPASVPAAPPAQPRPEASGGDRTPSGMSLITVAYDEDLPLLKAQAQSIERNLAPDVIGQILVVWNGPGDPEGADRIRGFYGGLGDRVDVLRWDRDLGIEGAEMPPWRRQQACKLLGATHARGEDLLFLDTKNLFVRSASRADFFAPDGRPRIWLSKKNATQRGWAKHSRAYLGLPNVPAGMADDDEEEWLLPPSVTPYPAARSLVADLVGVIRSKSGGVDALFADDAFKGTEFMLIYAYIMATRGRLEGSIDASAPRPNTLFRRWPEALEPMIRICDAALKGAGPTFGVHAARRGRLPEEVKPTIARIWRQAGLDVAALEAFYQF